MRISRPVALVVVAGALAYGLSSGRDLGLAAVRQHQAAPQRGLSGGAASIDALVSEFVAALNRRDRDALERLRVTEREYREWIVPGSVEPGQPPQILSEEASVYFWEVLNGKSTYFREALLGEYGGRDLEIEDFRFRKGTRRFANHLAHGRLALELEAEDGQKLALLTGSIAEVDGQFKFISFIRD